MIFLIPNREGETRFQAIARLLEMDLCDVQRLFFEEYRNGKKRTRLTVLEDVKTYIEEFSEWSRSKNAKT